MFIWTVQKVIRNDYALYLSDCLIVRNACTFNILPMRFESYELEVFASPYSLLVVPIVKWYNFCFLSFQNQIFISV